MEGFQSKISNGKDWLTSGGSRAEAAAKHEIYSDANGGPGWLRQRTGDRSETISEEGGVAQVYVLVSICPCLATC